jgi:hypothetical protein
MTKAQEAVQDRRWNEVSVQYSYGHSQFMTKAQESIQDRRWHEVSVQYLRVMSSVKSWPKLNYQSKTKGYVKF